MSKITFAHCTPDAEKQIIDMARVSTPANVGKYSTGPRLLKYLIEHNHWSPFEMASMSVKIDTTRDISAQIIRHRSFSYQEFSQRYSDVTSLAPIEVPELRLQDAKNRQNSIEGGLDPETEKVLKARIESYFELGTTLYSDMLNLGVAKECARKVLPMNSPTTLYMHGTLRSWIHYVNVRAEKGTQKEHRQIAEGVKSIMAEEFPAICAALNSIEKAKEKDALDLKLFRSNSYVEFIENLFGFFKRSWRS